MIKATRNALETFTHRYLQIWQSHPNKWPTSSELYRIPSPCVIKTLENQVCWRPQLPLTNQNLAPVAQGVDHELHLTVEAFYSYQLAGDMRASFNGRAM